MRYTFLQAAAARVERLYETSLTRPADNGPESLDVWLSRCPECEGNIIGAYPMRGSLDVSGSFPIEVHNDGTCDACFGARTPWAVLDRGLSPTKQRISACTPGDLLTAYGVPPRDPARVLNLRNKGWHT